MYSVQTKIFAVDPQAPDPAIISYAVERLRAGGLVSFPTETVYGLGANALDANAVARIFEVKQRPSYDPLIVHIASIPQMDSVAEDIPELARRLAGIFWPGPLTMVLRKRSQVAANVSAGLNTVAVRMPNHKIPLALIQASNLPVAAPSANLFTRPSPTAAQHVIDDLNGHVDVVLDGGNCPIGLESTVLDLTGAVPTLLRPGGTPVEALRKHIPNLQLGQRYVEDNSGLTMPGPGMLAKHYSPNASLILFTGSSDDAARHHLEIVSQLSQRGYKVGVMTTDEESKNFSGLNVRIAVLGSEKDLSVIGQNLFARMRELEKTDVDVIVMRAVQSQGLGFAIWDRLFRAAEQHVFDLDKPIDLDSVLQTIKPKS